VGLHRHDPQHIVLHPKLCAGAAAISDGALPAWERAVGALTLVHEAYHPSSVDLSQERGAG
jgi:hypothetical protein